MGVYLKESLLITFKTFPFVLLKFGLNVLLLLITLAYFFISYLISFKLLGGSTIGIIGFIISLIIYFFIAKFGFRYLTYMIKAGHISVITQLINNDSIPKNQGQISYGFSQVKSRFASSSVFFVIDSVVNSILKKINKWVGSFIEKVPIKAIQTVLQILLAILNIAISFIDEAILSYLFAHPKVDGLKGAKDGLVLYYKSWKSVLKTSTFLVLLSYSLGALVFGVLYYLLVPVFGAAGYIFWAPIIACAILLKLTFFDPFILTSIIVNYQKAIKNMEPTANAENELKRVVPDLDKVFDKAKSKL